MEAAKTTWCKVRYIRSGCQDGTGAVTTWRSRVARVHAQHVEDVAEVEPHHRDFEQHLVLPQVASCRAQLLWPQIGQGATWLSVHAEGRHISTNCRWQESGREVATCGSQEFACEVSSTFLKPCITAPT